MALRDAGLPESNPGCREVYNAMYRDFTLHDGLVHISCNQAAPFIAASSSPSWKHSMSA
jgi:hypothetical protein